MKLGLVFSIKIDFVAVIEGVCTFGNMCDALGEPSDVWQRHFIFASLAWTLVAFAPCKASQTGTSNTNCSSHEAKLSFGEAIHTFLPHYPVFWASGIEKVAGMIIYTTDLIRLLDDSTLLSQIWAFLNLNYQGIWDDTSLPIWGDIGGLVARICSVNFISHQSFPAFLRHHDKRHWKTIYFGEHTWEKYIRNIINHTIIHHIYTNNTHSFSVHHKSHIKPHKLPSTSQRFRFRCLGIGGQTLWHKGKDFIVQTWEPRFLRRLCPFFGGPLGRPLGILDEKMERRNY